MDKLCTVPDYVRDVLRVLFEGGFHAYLVGGCVRDILMGKTPSDYDIASSARPEEVISLFPFNKKITSGIKHGTVGIVTESGAVSEITSFRVDGEYIDMRRPDSVIFTDDIKKDLSRRDFTVNAMALSLDGELIDPFSGRADIEKKIIRAVGSPQTRFSEDALRIMRALRFSSVLGFDIEDRTAIALKEKAHLLKYISSERIYSEFKKLLSGLNAEKALDYDDVLSIAIPFSDSINPLLFKNRTDSERQDFALSAALFFYPVGKDGAKEALSALKSDTKTKTEVIKILSAEDAIPQTLTEMKKLLSAYSYETVKRLISFYFLTGQICEREKYLSFLSEVKDSCVRIKDLAVKGSDLAALGYKGKKIGEKLSLLLSDVIEGRCKNEKDELLSRCQ